MLKNRGMIKPAIYVDLDSVQIYLLPADNDNLLQNCFKFVMHLLADQVSVQQFNIIGVYSERCLS